MAAIAGRAKPAQTNEQFQAALALARAGDTDGALRLLERAHVGDAKHAGVRNALGVLRLERGEYAGAIALLKPLARELPNAAAIQLNLGNALVAAGRAADAIAPLKRATSLDATSALSWYGLARALQIAGRAAEAEPAYLKALHCAPDHLEARANLAAVYNFLDRGVDGAAAARAALTLAPSHAGAHFNLAVSLLAQRRWDDAWAEYEWRERTTLLDGQRRSWPSRLWDGGSVQGMTVLVHAEQGFGDTLQFVRYLPMLRARGARVILAVPAELHALLATTQNTTALQVDDVVRLGDAFPTHDCHVPLTGLPHRLQCATDAHVFVSDAPYLVAPVAPVAPVDRDGTAIHPLRVGLVWAGSGTHVNDMHRSCGLKALLSLVDEPGIAWVSLQAGERAADLTAWPKRVPIDNVGPRLRDFADTAATIAQLDVVVSVDSAVAHLAGAMGRTCLLLLPRIGLDWRWAGVDDGVTSPWYASVRGMRQSANGDWAPAVAQVCEVLREMVARRDAL